MAKRALRHSGPSLRDFKREISMLPLHVAHDSARLVAPALTAMARQSFDGGRTAYGDKRREGRSGPVRLVRTGALRGELAFKAFGTIVRAKLGTYYAKYLVGRFEVLPIGDRTGLPPAWGARIREIVGSVVRARTSDQQRAA